MSIVERIRWMLVLLMALCYTPFVRFHGRD